MHARQALSLSFFPGPHVSFFAVMLGLNPDVLLAPALPSSDWRGRDGFVMLELGLPDLTRLMATAALLQADAQRPRRLHYLALTATPPDAAQLAQWLTQWLALHDATAPLVDELRAHWPSPLPGFHRLLLDDERLVLTLVFGDVDTSLPQLDAQVDSFHLHPCLAQEPGPVWSRTLVTWLGRLAAPQATLTATMQAEPSPALLQTNKRALETSGFLDLRWQQVGDTTQHWLHARFAPRRPVAALPVPERAQRRAIVIGAGLAGAAVCERLSARGWQLDLIEQHAAPAQEASGNAAGIFMPHIARDDNRAARLSRAAYLFSAHVWQRLGGIGAAFPGEACGVLQTMRDAEQEHAQREAAHYWRYPAAYAQWLEADAASDLLGMASGAGWLYPQAGWVHPGGLCAALIAACGDRVRTHFNTRAMQVQRDGELWRVYDHAQRCIAEAPVLILASGKHALEFDLGADLPISLVRGQVTYVPAAALPVLPVVLCGDGYLTRPAQQLCSLGASYEPDAAADDTGLRTQSHVDNLARLARLVPPTLTPQLNRIDPATLDGRAAIRCVSADRLPLVGALPDRTDGLSGAANRKLSDWPRLPQVYGLLGYASRGVIWSSLAAELLAAQLQGEPLPLPRDLVAALDPARFACKAARRI
ncbi:FAD-dependent 5-carboxymethylaminomethyl-2-thiouridine(34) oxidoreductase MnmC [Herbaspirillum sp. RTI4]|uniref:FAD-dependent 5-carboxymethylaminomethyl-2-thiouridine(34) oxidoreductase MnmC n=1 Tax=Herbaspirillum sp. RTI4 TaxID=3048640 RepID=UPI002AB5C3EA|nr:FAD-dependent 5-carboxymethylaminomethyl-2-thiouridine(34) oxidoreductase MnmC [Herbaspirillum sp. RTI4]MDY7577290.1 FAD-dependent 5-carboxymethylaminomethyl-2-thiouridine(34) oxidoreductase MnmC [Herbaspirillum sp. RTI4]MEA9982944.1 FAD-dependent 5-carboxymethylaminomethyl-2-thiouridine(34) oxidoreductase MnmC [Herbaspirillum sp. RTI4]